MAVNPPKQPKIGAAKGKYNAALDKLRDAGFSRTDYPWRAREATLSEPDDQPLESTAIGVIRDEPRVIVGSGILDRIIEKAK